MNLSEKIDSVKIDFVKEAFHNVKEFVTFADSKANITLVIQGILVSVVFGTSLLSDTFQDINNSENAIYMGVFYGLIGAVTLLTISGIIISAIIYRARLKPLKLKNDNITGLLYFRQILKLIKPKEKKPEEVKPEEVKPEEEEEEEKDHAKYADEIKALDKETFIQEFSHQIVALSIIANKKFKLINAAICLMIINLFFSVGLWIFCGLTTI